MRCFTINTLLKIIFTNKLLIHIAELINEKHYNNIDEIDKLIIDELINQVTDKQKELSLLFFKSFKFVQLLQKNPKQATEILINKYDLVNICKSYFYKLENLEDYIDFFAIYPDYLTYTIDCIPDVLLDSLIYLRLTISDCINNKNNIIKLIKSCAAILYNKNFDIPTSFNDNIIIFFNLKKNEVEQLINKLFINDDIIKLVNDALQDFSPEEIEALENTIKVSNIDNLNIAIGEELDIDDDFFNRIHHTNGFRPLIYINGNVILGDDTEARERIHHQPLFIAYGKEEKLHNNDLVQMSMEEWNRLDFNDTSVQRKYHGVRAVIQKQNVCTIDGFEYTVEAADAINKKYNCKVFAVNFDSSPDKFGILRRFASRQKR